MDLSDHTGSSLGSSLAPVSDHSQEDLDQSGHRPRRPRRSRMQRGSITEEDWEDARFQSIRQSVGDNYETWVGAQPYAMNAVRRPGKFADCEEEEEIYPASSYYTQGEEEEIIDRARDMPRSSSSSGGSFGGDSNESPKQSTALVEYKGHPVRDTSDESYEEILDYRPYDELPCSLWSALGIGVLIGFLALYSKGPDLYFPTTGESFFDAGETRTRTEMFFPHPDLLGPCANDGACAKIMKAIGPVLPRVDEIERVGSCPYMSRDWLRINKDILIFTDDRIRQRFAFAVFFCEMDGGDWLENDMWLSDLHECDWYNRHGLDNCDRVEQLQIFRINDNMLQGTLPPELLILSQLYELTLSDNMITGEFPTELATLTLLDTFVMAFNQFDGSIPEFFFNWKDMVYWDIAYNRFTGTIPDTIADTMPELQVFLLENNDVSGTIPTAFGKLDLKRLHLDDNEMSGTIPSELGMPTGLTSVYLHANLLTGEVPSQLANLQALSSLTLHFNSLGRPNADELLDQIVNGNENNYDIDEALCALMYQKGLETITVDCESITCECCQCGEPQ